VEDEDAVRDLASHILETLGYEVLTASSGPEALALYEQHSGALNLLVTDMVMPEMNGRELARAVKTKDARIKVLYISGYAGDVFLGDSELDPGSILLTKPFTPEALATRVREVLDQEPEPTV
jgi:two-component system, cell cycle sensor histidine kinase and response regulator CckA